MYREETLSLGKLLEIVGQYHDKEALTLVPEGQVNNIRADSKQGGKCWRCDKAGHFAKECYRSRDHKCGKCGKVGHFEVCCKSKQQIVWQVIKDCPGAYNLHDDLRVVGPNENEHEANVERVMTKLQDNGITLNYDTCEIGVPSMTYMGDVLSGEGLKVSEERVKAIVEAPAPQNKSEVRSFLGSVQFCAKFISNFATISSVLWDLTCKAAEWR